jgi:hypothetical protein
METTADLEAEVCRRVDASSKESSNVGKRLENLAEESRKAKAQSRL